MTFWDRSDAGRRLAPLAGRFAAQAPVVVAIPRGGLPVAFEVARALAAPLDVVLVRKIVAPERPQVGIGAVAEQGVFTVDDSALRARHLTRHDLEIAAQREYAELMRRISLYRGARPMPQIAGRTVLVVDDGVATGNTARAAACALHDLHPRRLVLLAPVIAEAASAALQADYDEILSEVEPADPAMSVSDWYENYEEVQDADALALLRRARRESPRTEAVTPP